MKIKFKREDMLAAFQTVATVVPSRSPKAILQNVKIETSDKTAVLAATNLEMAVRIEVPNIDVERPGSALLPVDRFGMILRESTDEQLEIDADPQAAVVQGSHSEFKLAGADPDEFPPIVEFKEEQYHEVPARLLKKLIQRTLFATDTESSRYALGGVRLELEEDRITAVATDGRRLAKMEGPAHSVGGHSIGDAMVIVPAASMQLIDRALSDSDAEVQLAVRGNDILVHSPRSVIYSRLLEGRFPDWRNVFPVRQNAIRIDLPVGPLYAALRQAAVVTSQESRGVDFRFGEGTLVLAGRTAEVGQSRVELPIAYEGQPIKISLDHRFVAEFLRVLDPEKQFTLEVENSEAAAVCTTDDGYGYVIMPLAPDRQ